MSQQGPPADAKQAQAAALAELEAAQRRKRAADTQLANLEEAIWRFEGSYLEETAASGGNIIKGFDNYLKPPGSNISKKKQETTENDRLFSKSSATSQASLDANQQQNDRSLSDSDIEPNTSDPDYPAPQPLPTRGKPAPHAKPAVNRTKAAKKKARGPQLAVHVRPESSSATLSFSRDTDGMNSAEALDGPSGTQKPLRKRIVAVPFGSRASAQVTGLSLRPSDTRNVTTIAMPQGVGTGPAYAAFGPSNVPFTAHAGPSTATFMSESRTFPPQTSTGHANSNNLVAAPPRRGLVVRFRNPLVAENSTQSAPATSRGGLAPDFAQPASNAAPTASGQAAPNATGLGPAKQDPSAPANPSDASERIVKSAPTASRGGLGADGPASKADVQQGSRTTRRTPLAATLSPAFFGQPPVPDFAMAALSFGINNAADDGHKTNEARLNRGQLLRGSERSRTHLDPQFIYDIPVRRSSSRGPPEARMSNDAGDSDMTAVRRSERNRVPSNIRGEVVPGPIRSEPVAGPNNHQGSAASGRRSRHISGVGSHNKEN